MLVKCRDIVVVIVMHEIGYDLLVLQPDDDNKQTEVS